MTKNKILKTLLKSKTPLTVDELSKKLSYPIEDLSDYIGNLEKENLVIGGSRPYSEELKYSRERLDTVYHCSAIVPEYLRKEFWNNILTISSIIAAIASITALIIA
ncbi:unknown [Firmicutes bacterium CAG:646]|nr:unknown [Firmicutes bacterium CAG:646]